jgi:hypothetical protein
LTGVKNRIGASDVEESRESPHGIRVMELPGLWVGVHGASDFIVQVSQEDRYSFYVEVLQGRVAVTNKKDGSLVSIDQGDHVVFSGGKVVETKKVPPAEMERNWVSLTGQPPRQRQAPAAVSGNGHLAWWGVAGGGLVVIVLAFLAFRRIRPTPRGSG